MLTRTANLPEVEFGPGDTITVEGGESGEIWILVSGTLTVTKSGELVNSITRPGAIVGEISILLESRHGATVTSTGTSRLRLASDGRSFLDGEPELMRMVATSLAERLNFVSTYLADLKHQYGDAPGLLMVSDVLGRLATHQDAPARSGSARDPNPEF
jgi:CRP-like cAMP-binding protein